MAALLIALAVMAVLLTVAMPVWRHEAQREKEAELIFRGEQYARAVALYKRKNSQIANALPASIDILVTGRFLRKKYKDPMTKDGQFELMTFATQAGPGIPQSPPQGNRGGGANPGAFGGQPGGGGSGPVAVGGITGVRSKSQENSIATYRGATRYDQWAFTFNVLPILGGQIPITGAGGPGGQGGPGNPFGAGPGGRPGGPSGGTPGQPGPGGRGGRGVGSGTGPGAPPPVPASPGGGRPFGPGRRGGGL